MHVLDYFPEVAVLDHGNMDAESLRVRVLQAGSNARIVSLYANVPWKDQLNALVRDARLRQAPGILILDGGRFVDSSFWTSQDALIEQFESASWDVVYLGHGNISQQDDLVDRPTLQYCDFPPSSINAVAVRTAVFEALLDNMPDRSVAGDFAPDDWMTMLIWLAQAHVLPAHTFMVWPTLLTISSINKENRTASSLPADDTCLASPMRAGTAVIFESAKT